MEKATIKDLIARKLQKDNDKIKYYEIPVKSMGRTLTFKKPSDEMRLDMLDELGSKPDMRTTMAAYKKLIYLSCNLLQDQALHEELGIKDPLYTVDEVFDLDDILDIGDQLMDAMEPNVEEIKKLIKHDADLNLFAFYAVRGYRIEDLLHLSEADKMFLHCARENYYEEEVEKYKAIFGERG